MNDTRTKEEAEEIVTDALETLLVVQLDLHGLEERLSRANHLLRHGIQPDKVTIMGWLAGGIPMPEMNDQIEDLPPMNSGPRFATVEEARTIMERRKGFKKGDKA